MIHLLSLMTIFFLPKGGLLLEERISCRMQSDPHSVLLIRVGNRDNLETPQIFVTEK